jgi:hypothetical protein
MNRNAPGLLIWLFLMASISGFTYDVRADVPLRVEATVTDVPGREAVLFTITNTSRTPVEIDESALPWGNRYSVLLVALLKKAQEPVRAGYPVDDVFIAKPMKIEPGRQLRGTVLLTNHFGELAASRRKDDLETLSKPLW